MKKKDNKLIIVEGPTPKPEFLLTGESFLIGRGDKAENWKPDIDLSPDLKTSRKHARLFRKNQEWFIEDLKSKHGIFVGEKQIPAPSQPFKIEPGVPVKIGETTFIIKPANLEIISWKDLILQFEVRPAVNYALYHCDIPLISDLTITNSGLYDSPKLDLKVLISDYSEPWHGTIDPIPSKEGFVINRIQPLYQYEKLQGHDSRKKARLDIWLNGELIYSEEINILGFYEWPLDKAFRRTLACFVQPSHPAIQHLVLDALDHMDENLYPGTTTFAKNVGSLYSKSSQKTSSFLKVLYDLLISRYRIRYVDQASSYEHDSQVIRPPHIVLSRIPKSSDDIVQGEGTCIDLVLLFASCLEHLHLQPLIFLVRQAENYWHALLGCWSNVSERNEPLLTDYEKLSNSINEEEIILLETTGVTDRWRKKIDFQAAIDKAVSQFKASEFLYALDIAACRQTVVPLQFPLTPEVMDILRRAEILARKEQSTYLETRHLLYSFFAKPVEQFKLVIERAGGELKNLESKISRISSKIEEENRFTPRLTFNYRRAIEDSKLIAADTGVKFAGVNHLFYALLLSQSESIDDLLDQLGTSRKKVKKEFEELCQWSNEVIQTLQF